MQHRVLGCGGMTAYGPIARDVLALFLFIFYVG
jgi:hypothetical protein